MTTYVLNQGEKKPEPLAETNGVSVEQPSEKTVIIDGPLGAIYTAALNQIYAQETTAGEQELLNEIAISDQVTENDLYIYATDSKKIEEEGPINVFNNLYLALGDKKNKNKMAVIEANGDITVAMASLESYLSKNNIKVYFTRKAALESIYATLRK